MTLRPILRWPDPRLSERAAPVGEVTEAIRLQAADMLETMYAAPGRGLAAPQIGVMNRLFVMDPTWKDGEPAPEVLIDPQVLWASADLEARDEGCLSIPGIVTRVARPSAVRLRWTTLEGETQERDFTGFAAACAQHELDHLDGIVTLDRLSSEDRTRALAEYAA